MKLFDFLMRPRIKYDPLIKVMIFRDQLLENFRNYKKQYPHLDFAPVLKSNAYGHGLMEVASVLDHEQPAFFVVDSFFEALVLRRGMIRSKILIIGYTREELISRKNLKHISFTIASLESLKILAEQLKIPTAIHLKIDTGMHRQGILESEIAEAARLIQSNSNIVLEGLCSHLADGGNEDSELTSKQVHKWNELSNFFRQQFSDLKYFHLAATASVNIKANANVARVGLGLYDSTLEMRSVISSVKELNPGDKVGYGAAFEAKQRMKIATVPAGYNEGVDLRLSKKGAFLIQNKICAIVGLVSMNITSIDVSELSQARLQDEVIIISRDKNAPNSVPNWARICDTIPYEILIHIPSYLRREIV